jgi:hypothetical protein
VGRGGNMLELKSPSKVPVDVSRSREPGGPGLAYDADALTRQR